MIWIILALTLGASITSIMHGVFMLFGSLSITGAAISGIPSTMLAVLPIISAIFALIGGIIAFNQSKWGALFLFIAMGLCIPGGESTWIYGGLYFFAGLFCFFLKPKSQNDYTDLYDDYDQNSDFTDDQADNSAQDFYYMEDEQPSSAEPLITRSVHPIVDDVSVVTPQPNNEPPKLRRRMSKSCPECGAVVSRDAFYCPTCGAKLFVVSDEVDNVKPSASILEHAPNDDVDIQTINEQLFNSADNYNSEDSNEVISTEDNNLNMNDGDDMSSAQTAQNYRTAVKPRRSESSYGSSGSRRSSRATSSYGAASDAASSYTEYASKFSKGKKRKRSPLKKILSMTLLVAAVAIALFSLVGLRKLPPDNLPSMKPEIVDATNKTTQNNTSANTQSGTPQLAEVAIAENVLPDFTPDRTPKNGVVIGVRQGSTVNVRADHTTNSSIQAKVKVGDNVEVLDMFNVTSGKNSGPWYNIRLSGGREGWIYGQYLQPLGSGIPSGYSNALLKTFGSNKSELIEALGNPKGTTSTAEWQGLTVTLSGEEITRLRLTGSNRTLQNGLKPGMSLTALRTIMGYPSSIRNNTHNYNENGKTGLSIQLDKNNAISSITVNEVQ